MRKLSVESMGGRGGERRRRSKRAELASLGRLRRLEVLIVTLLYPQKVRWVTDPQVKAMIEAIIDGWGGHPREAVQVLDEGPDDGQGEGDDGTDREV